MFRQYSRIIQTIYTQRYCILSGVCCFVKNACLFFLKKKKKKKKKKNLLNREVA